MASDEAPQSSAALLPLIVHRFIRQEYSKVDPALPEMLEVLTAVGAAECWHKKSTFKARGGFGTVRGDYQRYSVYTCGCAMCMNPRALLAAHQCSTATAATALHCDSACLHSHSLHDCLSSVLKTLPLLILSCKQSHLLEVYKILKIWGTDDALARCGLMHSKGSTPAAETQAPVHGVASTMVCKTRRNGMVNYTHQQIAHW
jgi:hypothetical protein